MLNLSFHGGVKAVTGSCHALEVNGQIILIDCGMNQGERMCATTNFEPFGFDVSKVAAVLLTHAHYDHNGRIPLLVKRGYKGPIYCTPPTKELAEYVIKDGVNIMQDDAERCGSSVLYEIEDVAKAMGQFQTINYHTEFFPIPGASCTYKDAGHILGSAFITIEAEGTKFVFSGDIGNDDTPILPPTEDIAEADIVICESTYGNRDHEPAATRLSNFGDALNTILKRNGTAIIPAFSLERTQELLYALDDLMNKKTIPRVTTYLDSPLAIHATEVYREYSMYLRFDRDITKEPDRDFFDFEGLKVCLSTDDSKAINNDHSPKIIIAGSGMMSGGRVMHHLKRYLPEAHNGVIVVGYQADGTMGRQIQDGAKSVHIHNEPVSVRAQLFEIESFSAHGDRGKLLRWLKTDSTLKEVFLTHGDEVVKPEFYEYLKQGGITAPIHIPSMGEKFEIKNGRVA